METPASWRLQGKWTGGERSEDFAMTYTITGPATFERTMAALHEGQWQPVVTETCTRGTPGS